MSIGLKIGLIFLAVVLTIVLVVISIYFYYLIKRNRRLKILNKLKSEIKAEILVKADRVIIQIKKIYEKNHNYLSLLNKLTKLYDEIDSSINNINQKIEVIKSKYLSFSLSQFAKEVKNIKLDILNFNNLSLEFSELCHDFTDKDEFVRSEMVFLKNCLRGIIVEYNQNKALLNEVSSKIDELINELNEVEKDFDDALNQGEIRATSAFLDLYGTKVFKLAVIINEGPLIKTHIFYNIPNRTKELVATFNLMKKDKFQQFQHVNFNSSIQQLAQIHRQSRIQYELLNFEFAKVSIKKCHEIISQINNSVNLEILSNNLFVKNYNDAIFEIGKSLQRYVDLRKRYRIVLDYGYNPDEELSIKFTKINQLNEQLQESSIHLKNLRKDFNQSFDSKIMQLKSYMLLTSEFIELENQIEKQIWLHNVENLIFKNKFQKIESVINELIVNIREQDIIVSSENDKNLKSINKYINSIASEVYRDWISLDVKSKIDNLIEKVTNLYIAIGGDLQIAEMTKNMINELTSKRLIDEKLSYVLNIAEKDYMLGRYSEALNNIINFLGDKAYSRI